MPKLVSHRVRVCALAAIASGAACLAVGPASAQALEGLPDWLEKARGIDPNQTSAAVPNCAYKPRLPLPGRHADHREIKRWLERGFICDLRIGRSIASLFLQFLEAVDTGDGQRACRLLTRHEHARLGESLCPAQFKAIAGRIRVEREPFPFGFKFERRFLRGELSFRLVRPLESIRMRFEAERGRWRMANTRDLFRQRLPVPPPARGFAGRPKSLRP